MLSNEALAELQRETELALEQRIAACGAMIGGGVTILYYGILFSKNRNTGLVGLITPIVIGATIISIGVAYYIKYTNIFNCIIANRARAIYQGPRLFDGRNSLDSAPLPTTSQYELSLQHFEHDINIAQQFIAFNGGMMSAGLILIFYGLIVSKVLHLGTTGSIIPIVIGIGLMVTALRNYNRITSDLNDFIYSSSNSVAQGPRLFQDRNSSSESPRSTRSQHHEMRLI